MTAWLILSALGCAPQDPDAAKPYKIDPRLEVIGKGDSGQVFAVSGSTDLPDGAVVLIDLFRAQTIEGQQYRSKRVRVRQGRLEVEFRVFPGEIPPGKYHARVWFDLEQQEEAIKESGRVDGRAREARAFAHLQVGTFEGFVEARKAHAARIAQALERIAAEVGRAVAAGPQAVEGCRRFVSEAKNNRESEAPLDFHYGLQDVSDRSLHETFQSIAQCLNELKEGRADKASEFHRICEDRVREAKIRLGLSAPVPTTAAEIVRELVAALQVLVDERSEVRNGKKSSEEFGRRLEELGGRVSHLKLLLANSASSDSYERVEEISREIDRLLKVLPKSGEESDKEAFATWTAVQERLEGMLKP